MTAEAAAGSPSPARSIALEDFRPDGGEAALYLRPVGLVPRGLPNAGSCGAGPVLPLAGGRFGFALAELIVRSPEPDGTATARVVAPVAALQRWATARGGRAAARLDLLLDRLTRPRPCFAGIALDRPRLMGVLNVTPDSFSDGGAYLAAADAIAQGTALLEAGADLLDIGGESTRPGAAPLAVAEELGRVLPVIRHFAAGPAVISIDSRHAEVQRAALDAGAAVINDVTGLAGDPESLALAVARSTPVAIMHMRGEPATMQDAPRYRDAALDVFDWLEARVGACRAAGLADREIAVDPGIGFGKTAEHNVDILRHGALFHGLGTAVLFGVSRKRFIAALSRGEPPAARLAGSLATGLALFDQGIQLLRVHDIAETAQARAIWEALHPAGAPAPGGDA
ncbi:MAG: dihydropteroate synthase [Azospirillum sp.]|nr:dihydropteroate synthase [Azospirillum sp.]